jgi:hypothetical protein
MALLLQDSFNRLDSTVIGSTDGLGLLDPMAWTEGPPGSCRILSNVLRANVTGSMDGFSLSAVAWLDPGTPDVDITASGPTGNTSSVSGILFRYTDASNAWIFRTSGPSGLGGGDDAWVLKRIIGGVSIIIASGPKTSIVDMRVHASGSRIRCYVDGVEVVDIIDSNHLTVSKHGIYLGQTAGSNAQIDSFSLSEAEVPAPFVIDVGPDSGETVGGETVVILGYNFTGATAVKFGATNAVSFTVISDTRIHAIAPAHAGGTVNVNVTTPDGTSSAETGNEYSYSIGPPFIASVTPEEGPIEGGTSVSILGTRFTDTTDVDFGGTPAASFTVDADDEITAVTPAHANGTVTVVVTTPHGTSS